MEIWKINTWYWNLLCVIFSINAGIEDDTPWEDKYSMQSTKTLSKYQNMYRNIISTITISKAQLQVNQLDTSYSCSFHTCPSREGTNILVKEFDKVRL